MEKLLKALKEGVCIVSYKKIDTGEIRDMECTLNSELIPGHIDITQHSDSHHILVWALDRDAWRSFRASTMQGWKTK
jgi:hypothetical protein